VVCRLGRRPGRRRPYHDDQHVPSDARGLLPPSAALPQGTRREQGHCRESGSRRLRSRTTTPQRQPARGPNPPPSDHLSIMEDQRMPAIPPQEQMNRLLTAYWVSQALYVAAKLGLADLLKGGPRTADDLAPSTGSHAPSLYRLLRALASVGVFVEDAQQHF